jgi:phage tail sheath gpL-like
LPNCTAKFLSRTSSGGEDFDGYSKSIIVEIKKDSKTRLEYSHQPNLIGQFYIGAGLLQFK